MSTDPPVGDSLQGGRSLSVSPVGSGLDPQTSLEHHFNSDLDSGPQAQHHTLGRGVNQAAPGNHGHIELVNTVAVSGSAVTLLDVPYSIHYVTLTANCTITFPPILKGKSFTLVLVQDSTARTVTWPSTVRWQSSSTVILSTVSARRDVISFMCADGVTWMAFIAGKNYS